MRPFLFLPHFSVKSDENQVQKNTTSIGSRTIGHNQFNSQFISKVEKAHLSIK